MTKKLVGVAAIAVLALALVAGPAGAHVNANPHVLGGAIAITCTVGLDDFPENPAGGFPPGTDNADNCDNDRGGKPASANAALATVHNASVLGSSATGVVIAHDAAGDTQTWQPSGVGPFSSTVDYNEPCVGPEPLPVLGNAEGLITIQGTATGAAGSSDFLATYRWTRRGLTATIDLGVATTNEDPPGASKVGLDVDEDGDVDWPADSGLPGPHAVGNLVPNYGAGNDGIDNDGANGVDDAAEQNRCPDAAPNVYEVVSVVGMTSNLGQL